MDNLVGRLKEPSSYTAAAVLMYAFFPELDLGPVKEILTTMLAGVGVVMKEGSR